jgi:hypothetical protein
VFVILGLIALAAVLLLRESPMMLAERIPGSGASP